MDCSKDTKRYTTQKNNRENMKKKPSVNNSPVIHPTEPTQPSRVPSKVTSNSVKPGKDPKNRS